MPTDPSDPSSPKSSVRPYQTTTDEPRGGGGGIFFVILLLLLLGGGAAYYFLVYKPAASVGATVLAPPTASGTPKPTAPPATPKPTGYGNAERAQYVKQADDAFIALRDARSGAFTTALNTFVTAGGLNVAGLTSKDAIAARRNLVAQCQAANDDYEAFVKTQDATFKAELKKTPLIASDVDFVVNDIGYRLQTDKNLQLRGLQRDSLKTADDMLAYLDKIFGIWSINAAQHLVFKKATDAAPYTALSKTYSDQVTAMNKLQGEIKASGDPATAAPTTSAASPASAAAPTASPVASPVASPATSATP